MRMFTRVSLALISGLLSAGATAQGNEPYPTKPVQMVIPVGGGGSTDLMLRSLASFAEAHLGQKIVIVNRPGASGMLGVGAVANAAADGYTIGGVWSGPVTMAPHIEQPNYKFEDYVLVSAATEAPGVFCVQPSFPATNGKEFLEELRRSPDKYTYGTEGIGGFVHLAGERIFNAAGVKARAVPFSGANQTATAFLGGHIDIFGGGIASIIQHAQQGKAKCLLLTSGKRHASLPNTDGLGDLGLGQYETLLWRAVIAPASTPPDRVAKLSAAFGEALRDPRFKTFAESRGETPWLLDDKAVNKYAADEYRAMGRLVRSLNLSKK